MSRLLDPGTYRGKIVGYGISETKAGNKQAFITFEIPSPGGGTVKMSWYGGLSAEAKEGKKAPAEYTIATVLECGFEGEGVEMLAGGPESMALPLNKEMSLVIEDNEYEGNVSSRVKYVNDPSIQRGPKSVTFDEASKGLNVGALRATMLRLKASRKASPDAPDIPF